jgi:hypothetical protein
LRPAIPLQAQRPRLREDGRRIVLPDRRLDGDYEGLQPSGDGFQAVFVKTNCNALDAAGQSYPTTGPSALPCAPASSSVTTTTNTNPTDVFAQTLTP